MAPTHDALCQSETDAFAIGPGPQYGMDISYHREIYFRPPADVNRSASKFFRYTGDDLVHLTLRHVVFRINSKSASAITEILREDLSDAEIYELMDEYFHATKGKHPPDGGWEWEQWWKKDEVGRSELIHCKRLRTKMYAARAQYAENLDKANLRDVNITYTGDGAMGKLINDKMMLVHGGAVPYHIWQYNFDTGEIGMSLLVTGNLYNRVYPEDRPDVVISDNVTNEKLVRIEPPLIHRGVIFPFLLEGHSDGSSVNDIKKRLKGVRKANAEAGITWREGTTLEAVAMTPKAQCDVSGSPLQREWSAESQPTVADIVSEEDIWWQKDQKRRLEIMSRWDAKFLKPILENDSRYHEKLKLLQYRLSEMPPQQSEPGEDFELTLGLCKTYPASRNYKWHRNNIEPIEAKDNDKQLAQTEARFRRELQATQKFYGFFCNAADHLRNHPGDIRAWREFGKMQRTMIETETNLQNIRSEIKALRAEKGVEILRAEEVDKATVMEAGLDFDFDFGPKPNLKCPWNVKRPPKQLPRIPMQPEASQTAPVESKKASNLRSGVAGNHGCLNRQASANKQVHVASPAHDKYKLSMASPSHSVAVTDSSALDRDCKSAPAGHDRMEWQPDSNKLQGAPSSDVYTERDNTPTWSSVSDTDSLESFPEYEDPMIEQARAIQVTSSPNVEKLITEHRAGGGCKLATILEETGIPFRRHTVQQLPSETTMAGSEALMTPASWSNSAKGAYLLNEKVGDNFEQLHEPAVVTEGEIGEEVGA